MTPLNVTVADGEPLTIELSADKPLYVLGANGSGKSTLLFAWAKENKTSTLVAGNREINFGAAAVQTTAASNASQEESARSTLNFGNTVRTQSRAHNNIHWLNSLIFRLKSVGEYNNANYVRADCEGRNDDKAALLQNMPLKLLNSAFVSASMPLIFSWDEASALTVNKHGIETPYGFNEMSDGERAATILAACAILAKKDTAIFLDEPERHLHRAISSPLIAYLRGIRPDLKWVISTHDLSLPRDDNNANLLLVYAFDGQSWAAEVVDPARGIDPLISSAIYGARKKVIFIEGDEQNSLDLPIYKSLFPNVTLVPSGTCKAVQNSVLALNSAESLHQMVAAGIVDLDNRQDIDALRNNQVATLGVYAIESIYYHPEVIKKLLETAGTNVSINDIINAACTAITDADITRLSKDAVYKAFRQSVDDQRLNSIQYWDKTASFQLHFENPETNLAEFVTSTVAMRDQENWLELIKKLKIKSTSATNAIATQLGFGGQESYETAAKKLIARDEELREALRSVIPDPFLTS